MTRSFNTPAKMIIRSEWDKQLIKFIKDKLRAKTIYLGLPSPEAEDIIEWIDYIDEVIAFQCRDYPHPSSPDQSREVINQLEKKLSELERKGYLSNFSVYDGYIEEVILKGKDNSNIEFCQNEIITIYNLDFCNNITSPLKIIDTQGEVKEVYKFDAVEKLLRFQKDINKKSKKFLFFLTIHCGYKGKELKDFISEHGNAQISDYHRELEKLSKPIHKNSRFLKSYIIDALKNYFIVHGFIPDFFPTILYKGIGGQHLLHFTVIGTSQIGRTGPANCFQNMLDLIKQKFLTINSGRIELLTVNNIDEIDISNNPIEIFNSSKSYNKFWKDDKQNVR